MIKEKINFGTGSFHGKWVLWSSDLLRSGDLRG